MNESVADSTLTRSPSHRWWVLGACAVLMYAMVEASFAVGFATLNVVAVWPAAGLAYWMVARYGTRAAPFILIGDSAYAAVHLEPKPFYLAISAGNVTAALVGAGLARRAGGSSGPFASLRNAAVFVAVGAGTLSVVAGLIGTTLVTLRFHPPASVVGELGWRWVLSDFTGTLIVAPLFFGLARAGVRREWAGRRALTDALMLSVLLVLVWTVTHAGVSTSLGHYPTVLLTMPFIVWMATHTPPARLAMSYFGVAVMALISTLWYTGSNSGSAFLAVQLYLCVVVGTGLLIHGINTDRCNLIRDLERERAELEDRVAARTADLAALTERLEKLATTDPLTLLANRRRFLERAETELARHRRCGSPMSVVMVDLDHFKRINDSLGHGAGDEVLCHVAAVMTGAVREGIDLVARLGGEEFAILLPDSSLSGATEIAERVRIAVEQASLPAGRPSPTCSLGVAEADPADPDVSAVLSRADAALYQAKKTGRNRVCPQPVSPLPAGTS